VCLTLGKPNLASRKPKAGRHREPEGQSAQQERRGQRRFD